MVATKKKEVLWILDLVCQQETDGLKRLLPTVHVITKEEVVGLWRKSSILEQPQKIIVLPMNVT